MWKLILTAEYDADTVTAKQMADTANSVIKKIDRLLSTAQEGKSCVTAATAIVGRQMLANLHC